MQSPRTFAAYVDIGGIGHCHGGHRRPASIPSVTVRRAARISTTWLALPRGPVSAARALPADHSVDFSGSAASMAPRRIRSVSSSLQQKLSSPRASGGTSTFEKMEGQLQPLFLFHVSSCADSMRLRGQTPGRVQPRPAAAPDGRPRHTPARPACRKKGKRGNRFPPLAESRPQGGSRGERRLRSRTGVPGFADLPDHSAKAPERQSYPGHDGASTSSRNATARVNSSIRFGSFSPGGPRPRDQQLAADALLGRHAVDLLRLADRDARVLAAVLDDSGARIASTCVSGNASTRKSRSSASDPYSRSRAARR